MEITDIRIRQMAQDAKMKAVVSVTFDNCFVVHDIKIIEGQDKLFTAMPSRKTPEGEYKDIAHPINSDMRAMLEKAILAKYEEELANVIIAYEPVWAIGTGETATPEQANEVCAVIRALIARLYGKDAADRFVIQYGGSMNDGNAAELLAQYDVDGGLIGGASLVAEKFAKIVEAASK